jgi:hypothetical protein
MYTQTIAGDSAPKKLASPKPKRLLKLTLAAWLFAMLLLLPVVSQAHVKWFVNFSFADIPSSLGEVLTPLLFALLVGSAVVIGASVLIDKQLNKIPLYQKANAWLAKQHVHSTLIMRIGLGMVLLLSWQGDRLLMPDLSLEMPLIGWFQFFLALLLILPATVPAAGGGLLALYVVALAHYGFFYMLDYMLLAGVGYYLLVSGLKNERLRASGLPALYLTVGFSLCWVALEKIIYPQWGISLLAANPQLTLGLDAGVFLKSAAFIEFVLGYLLIICLLERPLAVVITLVFFTTTTIFGKTEVIGHTLIHASLLVFLVEGPGKVWLPPSMFHRKTSWRVAFAAVNFVLLFGIMLVVYSLVAEQTYREAVAMRHELLEQVVRWLVILL